VDKGRRGDDESTKGLLDRQKMTPLSIVLHGPQAIGKNVQRSWMAHCWGGGDVFWL